MIDFRQDAHRGAGFSPRAGKIEVSTAIVAGLSESDGSTLSRSRGLERPLQSARFEGGNFQSAEAPDSESPATIPRSLIPARAKNILCVIHDCMIGSTKAHATGTLARMVVTVGIFTGAVGCTGGSADQVAEPSAPAVAVEGANQAISKPPTDADGKAPPTGPVSLGESPVNEKDHLAAKAAFQLLITPGSDPAAWEAAQKQLVDLGAGAIPVLLSGLASTNAIERETAATVCALAGAEDARIQAALLKCLSDESSFVQANAAAALAHVPDYQPQVMATLTNLLAASDPQLRRMAAANLGSFGAEASAELPKLTAVLADNDAEVVTPVIQLLGRIGPSAVEAVPQLQKIAFEEDGELKQAAEQALLLIQTDDGR